MHGRAEGRSSLTVALEHCPSYEPPHALALLDRLTAALESGLSPAGQRVLLKPNLLSARGGGSGCTDPACIILVARWLVERGARVTVGDSPAFGSATGILRRLGVADALTRLGAGLSDFRQRRSIVLPSGRRVALAAEALDCDLLVNLPKVKAHAQVRVTLAVKNLFGCVLGMQKPWWHMAHGGAAGGFSGMIVDLLDVLPPMLSIVDGRIAMHVTGPLGGSPYPLGLMAASWNPVALDSALMAVLGVEPASVPLWEVCARRSLPGCWFSDLEFPLKTPDDLAVADFRVPLRLNPIRFNPLRFLRSSAHRFLLRLTS